MIKIIPDFHRLHYDFNPDIEISLAKPNKTIIGNLSEATNVNIKLLLGNINELTFSIPYYVEKNFAKVKNKNVDKIRQRYLLKVKYLEKEEWYRIVDEVDDLNDTNIKHVTAYLLPHQLTDKNINMWAGVLVDGEYRKEGLNAKQIMDNILSETTWKYNSSKSDSIFLTRYRAFEFARLNRLEAVFNIAETFNAVIEWDTHNKEIIFHDAEKYGSFNGLYVSDDKYLSSYEKKTSSNEMATRLRVYGKEGLTINEVNPIGTDYVEDFSYFLQGFEMDSNGNVISHSPYMEDDLCKAIINYQNKIENYQSNFSNLLSQKEKYRDDLKHLENELSDLEKELKIIQNEIDIHDSMGADSSYWKNQETAKISQINNKKSQINSKKSQISSVETQLTQLKNSISMENNFTQKQLEELDNYIIMKTYENEYISDPHELIELGKKELDKLNKPLSIYEIGLIYLLRYAEAQKDVKKLRLGDKIRINKKEINETVEAQIIEMDINFSERNIDLVIANFSTEASDEEALAKRIYKHTVTSSIVNLSKSNWDSITNTNNKVESLLNEAWDASLREITAGSNKSVTINNRGITITDPDDSSRFLRITNSTIGFTKDGGKTVSLAMSPSGVFAEALVGRILIGQELFMENEQGRYTFNQDGVTIKNTSFTLTSDSGVNGVTITPSSGIVVTEKYNRVRTTLNATDGIMVEVKKGGSWNKEFWYDPVSERLIVDGSIHARQLVLNGQNILTDNNSRIHGDYLNYISGNSITTGTINANIVNVTNIKADNIKTGTLDASIVDVVNLNASNINSGKIKAQYIETQGLVAEELLARVNGNTYATVTKDSLGGLISLGNFSGQQIELRGWSSYDSGRITVFSDGLDRIVIDSHGFHIRNTNNTIDIVTLGSWDYFGGGYLSLKEEDSSEIFTVSRANFSYKGQKVATQDWVSNQSYATKSWVLSEISKAMASPPSTES